MPRLPIDYSKTIIYRIVCKNPEIKECYVGHTTDFTSRKSCHKSTCNNFNSESYNCYVYQYIRANGNWENWDMIMIEEFSCKNVNEATRQERFWTEKFKATLNSNIPSRTPQEYYQEYHQKNKEYSKEYYEQNKYKIKNKNKEKTTCCCGSICRISDIKKHERTNKHIEFVKTI